MNKRLRFAVLHRDLFRCRYCGRGPAYDIALEVDHVMPRSQGGRDEMENLVTSCHDCNQGKKHYILSRPARIVLEDDYDPEQHAFEEALVLAEEAFTKAVADAYQRGVQDQIFREVNRDNEDSATRIVLWELASRVQRVA